MERFKKYTSVGVQDFLPVECFYKKRIENAIRNEFILSGYDEIETPSFEYYDVFSSGIGSYTQEKMIKFINDKGRIMVLRPDLTVPIARMYAASFKGAKDPQRLCYIQNAFSSEEPGIGKANEYTQAGVELIGEPNFAGDVEVISLAIRTLKNIGLKDFKIDIGHVGFFKGIISGLNLDESDIDSIRSSIDQKNMLELENILEKLTIEKKTCEKLKKLPELFGDKRILNIAMQMAENEEQRSSVENLIQVYEVLSSLGLEEYISIDLGMLHDIGYYSGIVFRGLTSSIGFPIISGGRYDELLSEFGIENTATGFAIGIKRVLIALEQQSGFTDFYDTYCIIGFSDSSFKEADAIAEELKKQGKRIVLLANCSKEKLAEEKKGKKALKAIYIDSKGQVFDF
ncbi:MAG: ATP phosphoribosyltransferase regulatory subunit [Eubacteriales bacterium]